MGVCLFARLRESYHSRDCYITILINPSTIRRKIRVSCDEFKQLGLNFSAISMSGFYLHHQRLAMEGGKQHIETSVFHIMELAGISINLRNIEVTKL